MHKKCKRDLDMGRVARPGLGSHRVDTMQTGCRQFVDSV